jgi:oligopeptide/dipeptide ABC transporter ATP-binding protein
MPSNQQSEILKVKGLKTYFFTPRGVVKAVDGISFSLKKGECLCIVGESGSGKTVTALSILGLVESPPGRTLEGEVLFHGEDLLKLPSKKLREIRGRRIAMIFQDPQSSLNPVLTIKDQIIEQIRLHLPLDDREAKDRVIHLLELMGIPQPEKRIEEYPHQFSGGMKQRVMIAMAMSCDPEIIIADEPTSALDVTVQAQILDLLKELKEKRELSIIFITHDLGIVADIADRIVVMYAGKTMERGNVFDIFDDPKHPYTKGLLECLPDVSGVKGKLPSIPGTIPSMIDPPEGCVFHPRCKFRMKVCSRAEPTEIPISGHHTVACHLYGGGEG